MTGWPTEEDIERNRIWEGDQLAEQQAQAAERMLMCRDPSCTISGPHELHDDEESTTWDCPRCGWTQYKAYGGNECDRCGEVLE